MTGRFSLAPMVDHLKSQQRPVCAYYYDLDFLSGHTQAIIDALPDGVRFYYAIKANSDLPVLTTLAPHVYGFEAASLGEVRKSREAAPASPIAFGGPGKTEIELEGALGAGVELYHIESVLQLSRLNQLAAKHGQSVDILLRVNPRFALPHATLKMAGEPTQFGIDQLQIDDILASFAKYEHVTCIGFHFHAISNNLDADSHLQLVRTYLDVSDTWQRDHHLDLRLINIGGGIGIDYAVESQPFDWLAYCTGLRDLLATRAPRSYELAMECGRFITADCGVYVTEVTDIKQNHDHNFAILRGGSHQFRLPSSWQHNHPFHVLPVDHWQWSCQRPEIEHQQITLCGELCTPKDVLARQVVVGHLRAGDLIVFEQAGAYGWHISHHDFLSHPHPDRLYLRDGTIFTR